MRILYTSRAVIFLSPLLTSGIGSIYIFMALSYQYDTQKAKLELRLE
jgi:hypothetical protein